MKTALALILFVLPVVTQAQTFQSAPGESLDSFIVRIAKDVTKLSRASRNVEVCGAIEKVDNVFRVTMTTGEKFRCEFSIGEGFTGQSLHTHPVNADMGFSDHDYSVGPGYLIQRGMVLHQDGSAKTVRRVKSR